MDDEVEAAAIAAIREGDVAVLARLVEAAPGLAASRLNGLADGSTLLHIASDWPGYFPNGPAVVAVLIAAGADPNARRNQVEGETPLHWAASSDDVDVARALIDGGADLETPDGSIGTPLDNAIGYACWHVARLLVARGARVDKLWHAAALGILDRLEDLLAAGSDQEQISQAFWHACGAGQRRAAERLLAAGADLNWTPDYAEGTPLDAASGLGTRQDNVIGWLRSKGAQPASSPTDPSSA
jgi:ankyrin repeat protein